MISDYKLVSIFFGQFLRFFNVILTITDSTTGQYRSKINCDLLGFVFEFWSGTACTVEGDSGVVHWGQPAARGPAARSGCGLDKALNATLSSHRTGNTYNIYRYFRVNFRDAPIYPKTKLNC